MTAKQRAARAKFKAVVAEAKKLRKKNPKLTQAQAVKQAWAISYSKAGKSRVGAAPKKKAATRVKAKKSKRTSEMHTDTKSHNVNIRVMSGFNQSIVDKLKKAIEEYNFADSQIILHKGNLKRGIKDPFVKKLNTDIVRNNVKLKKQLAVHIRNLKRMI